MIVEEKSLSELSPISYRISLYRDEDALFFQALVVAFRGTYRPGSRGDTDADYMRAILRAALSAWQCDALIVDLRELAYVWGDMMSQVMTIGRAEDPAHPLPVVVVLSDLCRPAILTLIRPIGPEAPPNALADSVEEGIAKARVFAKAREEKRGLFPF